MWMWIYIAHAVLFYVIGVAVGWTLTGNLMRGVQYGWSITIWGVFVRTVLVWHVTWSVNSLSHVWGYRTYDTPDRSRNNWIVGLISNGEGWHNNHHWDQRSARHGHQWWEIDVTWITICLLEKIGLAKNVVRPTRKRSATLESPAT